MLVPAPTAPPQRDAPPRKRKRHQRLLLAAADLIESRGWVQGTLVDYHGRMCMLGALQVAADEGGVSHFGGLLRGHMLQRAQEAIVAEVREDLRFGALGVRRPEAHRGYTRRAVIWNFNDHWRRTPDQVVAVLRAAAER